MKESCENCCYFIKLGNDKKKGECRKNPPSIDYKGFSYWPVIDFEYYDKIGMICKCSKWERK